MPKRLPILLEHSVSEVNVLQTQMAHDFDQKVRVEATEAKQAITCTKGCSSCCYHPVYISVMEGILLYRWLSRHGKWTSQLKKKLLDSADRQLGTAYEVWLLSLIPCPLLTDQGLCSAYEARPFNCRIYYATSDPKNCHPHHLGPKTRILSRDDALEEFHRRLNHILRGQGLKIMNMPIGSAILYGAQVCEGILDLSALDRVLFKDYVAKA